MKFLIVTGLSGSGKSVALNTLEDQGYYCIDNLPVFLVKPLATQLLAEGEATLHPMVCVGIDVRGDIEPLAGLPELIGELRAMGIQCQLIFLEADTPTLLRRFNETRRKHPLGIGGRSLTEALKLERQLLEPLRQVADLCLDTSRTNIHQLRELIASRISGDEHRQVSLMFQSFGFKHGVPADTDFVFDVRCLPNPHWQPELRPLTGLDTLVADYLEEQDMTQELRQELIRFLEEWIPRFEADGRSYLTVSLGCTGGQHRSVYMADQLCRHFLARGRRAVVRHRELS